MVGRICCDSEGRLNEHSMLLEGSVESSNGMRTKLDVSRLDTFKLFPGQVRTGCSESLLHGSSWQHSVSGVSTGVYAQHMAFAFCS